VIETVAAISACILSGASFLLLLVNFISQRKDREFVSRSLQGLEQRLAQMTQSFHAAMSQSSLSQEAHIDLLRKSTLDRLDAIRSELHNQLSENRNSQNAHLEGTQRLLIHQLEILIEGTNNQLNQMRDVVDEKLQKTLEERITRSFATVSLNLESIHKSLGEMNTLAVDVTDLRRILSGVKNRGILGEYQLGALLQQLLSPEQYRTNVSTNVSQERVEFAIVMPGVSADTPVLLPVDSKFPLEPYTRVLDAYDSGDRILLEDALKSLRSAIITAAKQIQKYINPPQTTQFAILFLPFEGLYAEVIRLGMLEELSTEYQINITGPSTMGAFLNSLQMGFRTLSIQKHSGEVWKILGQTKKEFSNFHVILEKAIGKIDSTGKDLQLLLGVRSNQILKALKDVEAEPTQLNTHEGDDENWYET
jgi:DNA recombination protein RmuC